MKRDFETEAAMKALFPDYPCAECHRESCKTRIEECRQWKEWFIKTWRELKKDLQKYVKHN